MLARWLDAILVVASWALVAIPAVMLLSGNTQQIERWLVVATILPLLGLLVKYFLVSARLERRNRSLTRNKNQMALAEELAGVGRWTIDLSTLEHRWSEEVARIIGVPVETVPDRVLLRKILPEGQKQIDTVLQAHSRDREPFPIEFEIESPERGARIIRAKARIDFDPNGEPAQLFMVVRDVSEEYSFVEAMTRQNEAAQARAEEATRLANTDPLTGLANRRRAMAELDRAIITARKSSQPLSIVVFDIDRFKEINDSYGHQIGDKVLGVVSRIAEQQARDGDLVARIGGEEFIWLIQGADPERAAEAAERLRLAIEAGTISAPVPAVTVSMGQATLEKGETSLMLFARTDDALYTAKRSGRNRVELAA